MIEATSQFRVYLRTVSVFASLLSITMSVILCLSRAGFPIHYSGAIRVLGLALLLLNVAPFGRERWFQNAAALTLGTAGTISLLGWFFPFSTLGWLLAALGCLLFAWNLVSWMKANLRRFPMFAVVVVAAGLLVGVYVSGKFWGLGYAHPLYEERLTANIGHIDAPFNSSISNMLRTYGKPSTGLDGIPYVGYHFGSHWFAASLAPVCGETVLEFYNTGTGIVQIPLLYASLLLLAGTIRRLAGHFRENSSWLPAGSFSFAVIIVGLLGPFPKKDDPLRISLMEIYDSDSYTLALAVSFLIVALAISFYAEWKQRQSQPTLLDRLAWVAIFPVLFAICAIIKISLGYLLVGMTFYGCLRLGLLRRALGWLHLASCSALFLAVMKIGTSRGPTKIALFNFDRIHPEWIPYFFFFYFFWVWVFLLLCVYQLGWKTLSDVRQSVRNGSTFALEVLLFCSLIGMIPYLVLDFGMGSWNYFTQYQTFLGLALVGGFLPARRVDETLPKRSFWNLPVRFAVASLFGCLVSLHLGMTTFSSAYNLLKANVSVRAAVAGYREQDWRQHLRALVTSSRGTMTERSRSRFKVLRSLEALGQLPVAEKKQSLVYIPKSNRAYWGDFRQAEPSEGTTSFLEPALTGIAMIDGLPEYEDMSDVRRSAYGFASYTMPTSPQTLSRQSLTDLEARARQMGFRQLIVVDTAMSDCCTIQKIALYPTP